MVKDSKVMQPYPLSNVESNPKNKKKKKSRLTIFNHIAGYGFILPSALILLIFIFYPFFQSIFLSFFRTDSLGNIVSFVGLQNYLELLTSPQFVNSMKVTFLFALYTVPPSIIIALILAVLTNSKLKGMRIFQFIFALPMAVSVGTASVIWLLLFNPTNGIFNYLLNLVGIDSIAWLSDPDWALISVSIMTIWTGLGINYIILLAGLQSIPEEIYESAKMDGAGAFTIFRKITIPLLSPVLFFVLVTSVIGALMAFGQFNILTGGGPMNSTNVFIFSLYQEAFVNFEFGLGSARAIILVVIILILTFLQFKFGEKRVHYK